MSKHDTRATVDEVLTLHSYCVPAPEIARRLNEHLGTVDFIIAHRRHPNDEVAS